MGYSFAPFWCLCQKLSLSPLYFNKTLLHKSSERSSLVSGPGLNSSPPEAKNPASHRSASSPPLSSPWCLYILFSSLCFYFCFVNQKMRRCEFALCRGHAFSTDVAGAAQWGSCLGGGAGRAGALLSRSGFSSVRGAGSQWGVQDLGTQPATAMSAPEPKRQVRFCTRTSDLKCQVQGLCKRQPMSKGDWSTEGKKKVRP